MAKKSGWLSTETELATRYLGSRLSVAKFTAKKIAMRGSEFCMEHPARILRRECPECWQELLQEIEES